MAKPGAKPFFLVELSHSENHSFYSMPGSSSFYATPPVNKHYLFVYVCACMCVNVAVLLCLPFQFDFVSVLFLNDVMIIMYSLCLSIN